MTTISNEVFWISETGLTAKSNNYYANLINSKRPAEKYSLYNVQLKQRSLIGLKNGTISIENQKKIIRMSNTNGWFPIERVFATTSSYFELYYDLKEQQGANMLKGCKASDLDDLNAYYGRLSLYNSAKSEIYSGILVNRGKVDPASTGQLFLIKNPVLCSIVYEQDCISYRSLNCSAKEDKITDQQHKDAIKLLKTATVLPTYSMPEDSSEPEDLNFQYLKFLSDKEEQLAQWTTHLVEYILKQKDLTAFPKIIELLKKEYQPYLKTIEAYEKEIQDITERKKSVDAELNQQEQSNQLAQNENQRLQKERNKLEKAFKEAQKNQQAIKNFKESLEEFFHQPSRTKAELKHTETMLKLLLENENQQALAQILSNHPLSHDFPLPIQETSQAPQPLQNAPTVNKSEELKHINELVELGLLPVLFGKYARAWIHQYAQSIAGGELWRLSITPDIISPIEPSSRYSRLDKQIYYLSKLAENDPSKTIVLFLEGINRAAMELYLIPFLDRLSVNPSLLPSNLLLISTMVEGPTTIPIPRSLWDYAGCYSISHIMPQQASSYDSIKRGSQIAEVNKAILQRLKKQSDTAFVVLCSYLKQDRS